MKRQEKTRPPGTAKAAAPAAAMPMPRRRHRMAPQDRERFILENALRFFAERGLAGQTRELARRLGVTQSLIYRYFRSKDVLIAKVYEKWFTESWNPAWEDSFADRSRPLEERLLDFYRDYSRIVYNFEWVKLFALSGLNGLPYHGTFVARNRQRIFPWIARELRHDCKLPPLEAIPLTEFEIEQISGLHATAFFIGQRRWLYNLPVPADIEPVITSRVRSFVTAAPALIAAHLASLRPLKRASE